MVIQSVAQPECKLKIFDNLLNTSDTKSVIPLLKLYFVRKNTIKKQNKNNVTFKYLLDIVHDFVKKLEISKIQAVFPCFGSRGSQVRILVPRQEREPTNQLVLFLFFNLYDILSKLFFPGQFFTNKLSYSHFSFVLIEYQCVCLWQLFEITIMATVIILI